jgi:dihydroorotate dehydrogenase electron transfer subunit
VEARVRSIREVAAGVFRVALECSSIAETAVSGQFVHIAVSGDGANDPLLRRPMSVCDADSVSGTIDILFRCIGRGTRAMTRWQYGDRIDLMGPIGRGFELPAEGRRPLLVAGGLGIAPLYFLSRMLCEIGATPVMLAGFGNAQGVLLLQELSEQGVEVHLVTEDGSAGLPGRVTEHLDTALESMGAKASDVEVYACGPVPMIRSLQRWCLAAGVGGQVSLESRMACGVGACLGCAQLVRGADGKLHYEHVCVDGPVFDISRVVLA